MIEVTEAAASILRRLRAINMNMAAMPAVNEDYHCICELSLLYSTPAMMILLFILELSYIRPQKRRVRNIAYALGWLICIPES